MAGQPGPRTSENGSQIPPSLQSKAQDRSCIWKAKDLALPLFLSVKRISDPGSNSD